MCGTPTVQLIVVNIAARKSTVLHFVNRGLRSVGMGVGVGQGGVCHNILGYMQAETANRQVGRRPTGRGFRVM